MVEGPPRGCLVVHGDTRNVGGQKIRGELNPVMTAMNRRCDRPCQSSFTGTRCILEEQMSLCKHAGQRKADHRSLAEQRMPYVVGQPREGVSKECGLFRIHGHRGSVTFVVDRDIHLHRAVMSIPFWGTL